MPTFDMAILVPKTDELSALERFLDADFSTPIHELAGLNRPVYEITLADLATAVVAIEDQGNAGALAVTDRLIVELDPAIVFLVGTALGNRDRCSLCSVVVSEMVHDLSEKRLLDDRIIFRSSNFEPFGRLRREVGRYQNRYDNDRFRQAVKSFAVRSKIRGFDDVIDEASVEFEHICAGNDLITGDFQQAIWNHDDRLACYDMESAGFARAVNQHNGVLWMVVRGISDFGDVETKRRKPLRTLSMASAAAFLTDFVTNGLKSCHPRTLRTPESIAKTLSPQQYYTRFDGYEWFRTHVRERLGVSLPASAFGRDLTLDGFAAICERPATDRVWLRDALTALRREYFEEKYLNYTYEDDIRGFVPGWAEEVHDIYRRLTIRLDVTDFLVVGCGNGLELHALFGGAKSVTAVDISKLMLEAAAERFMGLRAVEAAAENLLEVETDSMDVYVALRTYMSRFFNMRSSMAEAYRVLRPGGYAIISIANGYLNRTPEGKKEVVRGLTVPGAQGTVDSHEPYRVLNRVRELLTDLGFENIQVSALATDIYIWAQTPARDDARSAKSPRLPSID